MQRTHAPGRPVSLGHEVDLADAAALLMVYRAAQDVLARHGRSALRFAREAQWFVWEAPRLPPPLVRDGLRLVEAGDANNGNGAVTEGTPSGRRGRG